MDYSKLSDFEINKLVGDVVFKGLWSCRPGTAGNKSDSWYYGNADASLNPLSPLPDYCNDAADAWQIIVGHKLSIINADDEWLCVPEDTAVDGVTGDGVHMIYSGAGIVHSNPLRAAMVMFLTIQDESNADV
ncbi:TPA: DUF2591 family protein [Enterobacter hormaechei]|uniref:phage protein NinX family protein n=1 Tax=Enterobacter hormaechei TaxID=158836 RepID=UPI0018C2880D|nr:phage protein NinX family protein [Enterobacter hormaechei]MBG0629487.1 DUF2591 family protein [Enterobacter hormaechei]HEM7503274.1 DUF2591 family protein [Enterobacter hormaechei]